MHTTNVRSDCFIAASTERGPFSCGEQTGSPTAFAKRPVADCSAKLGWNRPDVLVGDLGDDAAVDPGLTLAYRARPGAMSRTSTECCYSACVPVKLVDPDVDTPIPPGHTLHRRCITHIPRRLPFPQRTHAPAPPA